MSDDIEQLCSTIETRPDNNSLGRLTDLLNTDENIEHDKILQRCGKYLSGINLDSCFSILLKKNQFHLMEIFLRHVDDLTEKQLIQSLNLTFDYLPIILVKRYDYWSLIQAMKTYLNPLKSVDLAEQLVTYLVRFEQPNIAILDWLCALIDAHFSSFVLAKWNKIPLIDQFVQDRLMTLDLLQDLNISKKNSTTATMATNKKSLDNLYTLQRIHFK